MFFASRAFFLLGSDSRPRHVEFDAIGIEDTGEPLRPIGNPIRRQATVPQHQTIARGRSQAAAQGKTTRPSLLAA